MCRRESALTLAAVAAYVAAGCAVPQGPESDGLLQLSAEVLRTAGLLEPSSYNSRSQETVSLLARTRCRSSNHSQRSTNLLSQNLMMIALSCSRIGILETYFFHLTGAFRLPDTEPNTIEQ